jgi:hypothetical protein
MSNKEFIQNFSGQRLLGIQRWDEGIEMDVVEMGCENGRWM